MLRAAAFLLFVSSGSAPAAAQTPEQPLVCRVALDIDAFEGQTLTLSGQLVSDFHHSSGITNAACPDTWVLLGRYASGVESNRTFEEAALVARVCPQDPLLFTVTGTIERQQLHWRTGLALTVSEFTQVRRAPDSQCPMTYQALEELNARYRASQQR